MCLKITFLHWCLLTFQKNIFFFTYPLIIYTSTFVMLTLLILITNFASQKFLFSGVIFFFFKLHFFSFYVLLTNSTPNSPVAEIIFQCIKYIRYIYSEKGRRGMERETEREERERKGMTIYIKFEWSLVTKKQISYCLDPGAEKKKDRYEEPGVMSMFSIFTVIVISQETHHMAKCIEFQIVLRIIN